VRDRKRTLGCALFSVLGIAWLCFTGLLMFAAAFGDCSGEACAAAKNAEGGLILWRGIAVGLLLILAYVGYRHFVEDDDVS
jgi:hypothetical protein